MIAIYTGDNGTITIIAAFDGADIGIFGCFTVDNRVAGRAICRRACRFTVFMTCRDVAGVVKNRMFAGITLRNEACSVLTITVGMNVLTWGAVGATLRIGIDTNLIPVTVFGRAFCFGTICIHALAVFAILARFACLATGAAVLNIDIDLHANGFKRRTAIRQTFYTFKSTARDAVVILTSDSLVAGSV